MSETIKNHCLIELHLPIRGKNDKESSQVTISSHEFREEELDDEPYYDGYDGGTDDEWDGEDNSDNTHESDSQEKMDTSNDDTGMAEDEDDENESDSEYNTDNSDEENESDSQDKMDTSNDDTDMAEDEDEGNGSEDSNGTEDEEEYEEDEEDMEEELQDIIDDLDRVEVDNLMEIERPSEYCPTPLRLRQLLLDRAHRFRDMAEDEKEENDSEDGTSDEEEYEEDEENMEEEARDIINDLNRFEINNIGKNQAWVPPKRIRKLLRHRGYQLRDSSPYFQVTPVQNLASSVAQLDLNAKLGKRCRSSSDDDDGDVVVRKRARFDWECAGTCH
ncbi:hypothetical protein QQX98_004915 [Neonectria punicea]|uniref:Uncharacterized protein n=1 Tax=Neonectria punicea TaxID=979145 RepID=A0ABR1H7C6_9HYPO